MTPRATRREISCKAPGSSGHQCHHSHRQMSPATQNPLRRNPKPLHSMDPSVLGTQERAVDVSPRDHSRGWIRCALLDSESPRSAVASSGLLGVGR